MSIAMLEEAGKAYLLSAIVERYAKQRNSGIRG